MPCSDHGATGRGRSMSERRLPGPPIKGAYGVVYVDANGRPTSAVYAVTLEFREFNERDELISTRKLGVPARREVQNPARPW
jgi:hypothetical protein